MNAPYDIPTYERLALVHPALARRVHAAEDVLAASGEYFRVANGLRSYADQDADFAKVPPVTKARGGYSWHQFGMAVDCYPFKAGNTGDLVWDAKDQRFVRMVAVLKSEGLVWGGDWKTIKDPPHFQLAGIPVTPTDEVRAAFATGGLEAVWALYPEVEGK
jgi:peptidoglycan L-alanyl-D-glutamate endopeptidase CwlK